VFNFGGKLEKFLVRIRVRVRESCERIIGPRGGIIGPIKHDCEEKKLYPLNFEL
jgi:hypothetical protein